MALSTNRTLITQTGINTHQVLNVGGLDSAGIATFSNFKTGLSNNYIQLDLMLFQILVLVLQLDQLVMLHFQVL